VIAVAPRMINDVVYMTRIKYANLSAGQAQYLLRLEGDTCCSVHGK